jgi:hypothetical protein
MARTTVTIEIDFKPVSIGLETRHETLKEFMLAHHAHTIAIVNERGLNFDELAQLASLGEIGEFVQQALTNNRRCCWLEPEPVSGVWTQRLPVGPAMWYRIQRDGMEPVRKIVRAFQSLFPSEETLR